MWTAKLNRHFSKIRRALKISAFLIFWNILFHAFTLSILVYWSLTSSRINALARVSTLNQFLSENQILFAAISALSALVFFRDAVQDVWNARKKHLAEVLRATARGLSLGMIMITAQIFHHEYQFLGFTAQLNLNFLASYAWILRAVLIFIFVFATEFLTRVVIAKRMERGFLSQLVQTGTLLSFYAIWFTPKADEWITLILLFSLFNSFWTSLGFISALFTLTHAIFGLNFFENEFSGLLQLKLTKPDETFFQNHALQAVLVVLLTVVLYARMKSRKETA